MYEDLFDVDFAELIQATDNDGKISYQFAL
jgi:hypothetical protein